MKFVFATNNAHKLTEVRAVFEASPVEILSLKDVNCTHETVEDGETFYENAIKKAREIAALTGKATLADDTGLCVEAMNGRPGVYSNRFAPKGQHCEKLLEALKGENNRKAYFMTSAVCVLPNGREFSAEGRVEGSITTEKHGDYDFGYDQVFYVTEAGKNFGEMTVEEKNSYSHRSRAFTALAKLLKDAKIGMEDEK